jgi:Na+/H+ antiporter NhaD/arsenite permease-like protein
MTQPNPWMVLPFGLLLALIALGPLFFAGWWGRHYPKVSIGLGVVVVLYYFLELRAGEHVAEVASDYVRFIALIGSLFVVAGGIHITVKGEATPRANVVFLLFGAITSNFIGTTGASMLLIRPWLRMNKYRVTGHHVVFFIFIVSNVGGCLTPVGDPPLYLGYLKGIPFWWVTEHCWPIWAAGLGVLLVMFYWTDRLNYQRAPSEVRKRLAEPSDHWRFEGLSNLVFLSVILAAAFVERPLFLREILMTGAAVGSYFTTSRPVHESNNFNFHPIKEVAILFAGIFATMMPALDWLQGNAGKLGDPTPASFFFGSGILSSVLDNAPTYLTFLSAIFGSFVDQGVVAQVQHLVQTRGADLASLTGAHAEQIRQTFAALRKYHAAAVASGYVSAEDIRVCFLLGNAAFHKFILAISAGSVFFGANTYIGNGPNFMVKAIAEQNKVHTPTFGGYVAKYTLPVMVPMLLAVWWLFFRG